MNTLTMYDTSSADTYNFFRPIFLSENNADIITPELNWYFRINYKNLVLKDFSFSDTETKKYYIYLINMVLFLCDYTQCENRLSWLRKSIQYEPLPIAKYLAEEENTASEIENLAEFVFTPKSNEISWQKASQIALSALVDAEKRRLVFAEEEARTAAIWEESD